MNFLFFTIITLVIGIIAGLISKNGCVAIVAVLIAHFILLVLYVFKVSELTAASFNYVKKQGLKAHSRSHQPSR